MKRNMLPLLPEARQDGIIVRDFEGEVLVYDVEHDKAHCLNPMAAQIWRLCDGRTTVSEIGAAVSHEAKEEVNDDIVLLGLEELRRSHLLVESNNGPQWFRMNVMSRREAVRRIGLGAAITLPLVASMAVPTAVQAAASCRASCQPCAGAANCCSGACGAADVLGCAPPGNTSSRCV